MGNLYASSAFVLWGFLPLYWKALGHVPALEILAHRIWWSFVFVMVIILFMKRKLQLFIDRLKNFRRNGKEFFLIATASIAISGNWLVFIWAVNSGKVIEASLGMYITPLISILFGVVLFKERLRAGQSLSILLALLGVCLITVKYGNIPWVALSLALTSGVYSFAKKCIQLDALVAMGYETLMVTPFAFIYLLILQLNGTGSFGASAQLSVLLIGAGIVTALPLIWFAEGTKRISLVTVGVFQYLSPSIAFFVGLLIFKEPVSMTQWVSFILIWAAITIYTLFSRPAGQGLKKEDCSRSRLI